MDKLIKYFNPPNAYVETLMREHLFNMIWLVRKCMDNGMTEGQILQMVLEEKDQPWENQPRSS